MWKVWQSTLFQHCISKQIPSSRMASSLSSTRAIRLELVEKLDPARCCFKALNGYPIGFVNKRIFLFRWARVDCDNEKYVSDPMKHPSQEWKTSVFAFGIGGYELLKAVIMTFGSLLCMYSQRMLTLYRLLRVHLYSRRLDLSFLHEAFSWGITRIWFLMSMLFS